MKRAQITIFFILGLLILVGISLIFAYRQTFFETIGLEQLLKEEALPPQIEVVRAHVDSCADEIAQRGVFLLGTQGGYTSIETRLASDKLVTDADVDYKGTAYLYYKGQNRVPTTDRMALELSKYINERLSTCKKNDFPGLKVDFGSKPATKTKILDNKVEFEIDWRIKVEKDESEYNIKKIRFEMPKLRMGELKNIIDEIVNQHVKLKADKTCLSCLVDISAENDVKIDVQTVDDDVFFMVTDETSKVGTQPFYTFILANKF